MKDVLVKVDTLIISTYFVVLDMEYDRKMPIVLSMPFLATCHTLVNVENRSLLGEFKMNK